jgi:multiple sugar transport system substrate-binding protein
MFFFLLITGCAGEYVAHTSVTDETTAQVTPRKTAKAVGNQAASEDEIVSALPVEVNPNVLRGIKIQFWHAWGGEAASVLENLASDFNRNNTFGIEVEIESRGYGLHDDVQRGLNSGQFPDLVLAASHDLLSWRTTRDVLVDFTPYILDPEYGLTEVEIKDFQTLLWEQDVVNGIRIGVPSHGVSALLAYNESWAKELGYDTAPTMPESFTVQTCAAAAASGGDADIQGEGGFITWLDPAGVMSWIQAFDGKVVAQAGEGYIFNSPGVVDAFDYVWSLFKSGCAFKPPSPYAEDEFAERRGLVYATEITDLPNIAEAFGKNEWGDVWTVIPYPTETGQGVVDIIHYSFAMMESNPEKQQATWLFLKWMVMPENQDAMVEASSTHPGRISTLELTGQYALDNPQWAKAQELFFLGALEPRLSSWRSARWAVGEVAMELLSADLDRDEIPALLSKLDKLLAEIQAQHP